MFVFALVFTKPNFRKTKNIHFFVLQATLSDEFAIEEKLGFIMFECGWEGVAIKIVKKSQFEHAECDKPHAEKDNLLIETQKPTEDPTTTTTTEPQQQPKENSTPKIGETEKNKNKKKSTTKSADGNVSHVKDTGNVSSCVIELKVVWFNFAAPPRAPITRKIDYTRLDWNLLSTVSPAINAWMNPSNRLAIRVVHMVRTMYRRSTAIIACLMAEAMDIQGIHQLTKVRNKSILLSSLLHSNRKLNDTSLCREKSFE